MDSGQFGNMHEMGEGSFCESIEAEIQEEEQKRYLYDKSAVCRTQTDALLQKSAYRELQEYYQTEELRKLSKIDNDIAIFCIVLSIYQMELQEGIEQGILDGIRSMEETVERYLKAKFLLWRLEFGDEEVWSTVFKSVQQISIPFLKYLIHVSSFQKVNTAFKLAMLLKGSEKLAAAFAMLNYVNELSPNQEIVYCEMADICMMTGQYKAAADCIAKVEDPSEILVNYQQKWGL